MDLSLSNEIIPEKLDKLYEYLALRHFFVHGYGFMLEKDPLEQLANDIPALWSQFISEIEKFLESYHER